MISSISKVYHRYCKGMGLVCVVCVDWEKGDEYRTEYIFIIHISLKELVNHSGISYLFKVVC